MTTENRAATELALANYGELLRKVDAKFAEIWARQGSRMRCDRGCHSCCRGGLTVSDVERAALAAYLRARPALVARILARREGVEADGSRCAFLGEGGDCLIYEARPLVCRSHGAPLVFKKAEPAPALTRDVCPLNFAAVDLASLPAEDFMNLDTLNTLLALLNAQLRGDREVVRTALAPAAILAAQG